MGLKVEGLRRRVSELGLKDISFGDPLLGALKRLGVQSLGVSWGGSGGFGKYMYNLYKPYKQPQKSSGKP